MELLPVTVSVGVEKDTVVGSATSDVGSQLSVLVRVAVGRILVTPSTVVDGIAVGVVGMLVEVTTGEDGADVGTATVELWMAVDVAEAETVCESVGTEVGTSVLVPFVTGMVVGRLVAVPVAEGVTVPVVELPMGISPVVVELTVGRLLVMDVGTLVTVGTSVDVVLPIGSVTLGVEDGVVVESVPIIDVNVGRIMIGVSVVDVSVPEGTSVDVSVGTTVVLAGVGFSTELIKVSMGLRMPPSVEVVVTASDPVEVLLARGVVSTVLFSKVPEDVSLVLETMPVGAMMMGVSVSEDSVDDLVEDFVVGAFVVVVEALVVGRSVGLEVPPVPSGRGGTMTVLSTMTVFILVSPDEVSPPPKIPEMMSPKVSLLDDDSPVVVVGGVLGVEMGLVSVTVELTNSRLI